MSSSTGANYFDPALFYALIGTIVGFILFALWDEYKDSKSERKEREQLLRLLAVEATDNLSRVDEIKRMLSEEIRIIASGKLLTTSPINLLTDGWTIAKSKDLMGAVGNKLQTWISVYTIVGYVNNTLSNRELFRSTSHSITNYKEMMQGFDQSIIDALDEAKRRIDLALATIPTSLKPPISYQQPQLPA